jgi:hypothetical protein
VRRKVPWKGQNRSAKKTLAKIKRDEGGREKKKGKALYIFLSKIRKAKEKLPRTQNIIKHRT